MMKRKINTGLGALTPSAWEDIVATVDAVMSPESGEGGAAGRTIAQQRVIDVALTTAQQESGIGRWQYDWQQVRRTANTTVFATFANAMTSATNGGKKAVNTLESGNTASSAYGMAVTGGVNLTNHAGYTYRRVPAGVVVQLTIRRDDAGKTSFEFSAPNLVDGSCTPQGLVDFGFDYGSYSSPQNAMDYGEYGAPIQQADYGGYDDGSAS